MAYIESWIPHAAFEVAAAICSPNRESWFLKMHLVLQVNLDLLLRGRDNLVLGCTLEVREVCHSILDDVKRLLDLLLCNDQRRRKTNDVLVGRFGLENTKVSDSKTSLTSRD